MDHSKKDQRFYAKEIQFSSLLGGADGAFENFSEFRTFAGEPLQLLCGMATSQCVVEAFQQLPPLSQFILQFLIIEGKSERWLAKQMGLAQQTIHNRKKRALVQLRVLIDL